MAGWIRRTFFTRNPVVMLTLLKQLIYPTMEYNSVLWSPVDNELIDLLESVQYNFLRCIKSTKRKDNMDYIDLLNLYKLYSLQRRRERYCIIYTWKIIHNLYPNPGLELNTWTKDHIEHPNQGIQINIHQRDDITTHHTPDLPNWLSDKSVLERCCKLYNLLPLKLRLPIKADKEPNLLKFKEDLDKWLTRIPDRPTTRRSRPAGSNSLVDQIQNINRFYK